LNGLATPLHKKGVNVQIQAEGKDLKKLLSLLFATMVVFTLSMPALASGSGNAASSSTTKAHKTKTGKTHKAHKTSSKNH
jgi:hypothetical protein